ERAAVGDEQVAVVREREGVGDAEGGTVAAARELGQGAASEGGTPHPGGAVSRRRARLHAGAAGRPRGEPRAVRADRDAEDEPAVGAGDLIDALAVRADAVDLPRFAAGVERAVGVAADALGMIEAIREGRGFGDRYWHRVLFASYAI